jgi:hypothetical protein
MIDYERAKRIALKTQIDDACLREFAAKAGSLSQVSDDAGRLSVRAAWEIYSHRAQTAKTAGIHIGGIDRTVQHLAELDDDETILLFHFDNDSVFYTILMSDVDESFVGCISGPRRRIDPDVDWSTGVPVHRR